MFGRREILLAIHFRKVGIREARPKDMKKWQAATWAVRERNFGFILLRV